MSKLVFFVSVLVTLIVVPAFAGAREISVNLFDGAPVRVSIEGPQLVLQPSLGKPMRYKRLLRVPVEGSREKPELSLEKVADNAFVIHFDGFDGMHTGISRDVTVVGSEGRLLVTQIAESRHKAWDGTVSIDVRFELALGKVDVSFFDQEIGMNGAEATASLQGCGEELRTLSLEQYDRLGMPACVRSAGEAALAEAERKAQDANR